MVFLENVGRRSTVETGEWGFWVEMGAKSLNGNEANRLFRNDGGKFTDVAWVSGAALREDGRSAVVFDADGDGDLDLAIQNFEDEAKLLINQGASGHWLQVRLQGEVNRFAIGARVEVQAGGKTQWREVTTSAGYLSGVSLQSHFGLGHAERVERLTVHWPGGGTTVLEDLPVDRALTIDQREGLVPERP